MARSARARSKSKERGAAATERRGGTPATKLGYAVVGLGYIAQAAVLPAFAHARRNSRLLAFVSDDPRKRSALTDLHRQLREGGAHKYYLALANGRWTDAKRSVKLPSSLVIMVTFGPLPPTAAGSNWICSKRPALPSGSCSTPITCAGRLREESAPVIS